MTTTHQLRMPICKRCNKLHDRFLEFSYSALCQECHDRWIVDTFCASAAAQHMTDEEALVYLEARRPELFESGILPDYLIEVRAEMTNE